MSSSTIPEAAKAMIGRETGAGEPFEVERGLIRRFAEAIRDSNPMYLDESYARGLGYNGIPAQPSLLLYNMRSGSERDFDIPLPVGRRVKAGDEVEILAPVLAGDTITADSKIVDIYEKEGRTGKMIFIITETTYRNQRGEAVMRSRASVIKR